MSEAAPHQRKLDARIKRRDLDRWLASRLAPPAQRARLIAVYAAVYEIAKTAEKTQEARVGAIRLAWWRETIAGVGEGRLRAHPAAEALAAAHAATPLPLAAFEAMIDARAQDFEAAPFQSWSEQSIYVDATAGGVFRLALAALEISASDAFIRDAGRAWGLTGLLRARTFWAERGRRLIPVEARDAEAAARLMANTAQAAYVQARASARALASEAMPAIAYLSLVPRYLSAANPPSLLSRQLRILGASLWGRI
ncbi:MAG: squalene/phytoene synthase family protein [Hydrogenophilaceae bacterium]|jgi:phytoene synthase|nr:squalene/phytoene synthase family protein [Hydrogenophilaceae bacterium]